MRYRRAIGFEIWHFQPLCTKWPRANFQEAVAKPRSEQACDECMARKHNRALSGASGRKKGRVAGGLVSLCGQLQAALTRRLAQVAKLARQLRPR